MTCRRTFELDLPGFLADPRAPGFADFRDHYPRCAACAAEVRAWTELSAQLASAAPAHPEPERLLRYADRDAALTAAARGAIEAHLARCAACRDELAALAAFEPGALAAAAPPRAEASLAGALAGLRRLLWQPALAWAVALLLALPTVYTLLRPGARARAPVIAAPDRDAAPAAATPAAELAPPPAPPAPAQPAAEAEAAPPALAEAAPARGRARASVEETRPGAASAPRDAPAAAPVPAEEPAASAAAQAPPPAAAGDAVDARETHPGAFARLERAATPALALSKAGPPALRFEARGGGVAALRVPVPAGAGEVEVRLVAPDGRALEQRFPPAAGEVELLVAESWLGGGAHRVEVRAGDAVTVHTVERR